MGAYQNWARNYTYSTDKLHTPENVEQVKELVARCKSMRVLGTRHSFNGIADSSENLISLSQLNQVVDLDHEQHTVTVEGGIKYGDVCKYLNREGFALHNMASLPHISVAGAVATATHGSGDQNGNLATVVRAMELVTAEGEVIQVSREHDQELFDGMVVGLGGLGVVTKLTLDIVPSFEMRQHVYENLPLSKLEEHFNHISSSAYSVSLFTDWQDDIFNQVWLKSVSVDKDNRESDETFFGASAAITDQHVIKGLAAENCTRQMGVSGPWHERLPHFVMDFTPSYGDELQSEYMVPRQFAYEALCAIDRLKSKIAPLLHISEVRTIAEDNLWMSPCYRQDSVGIHFTWKPEWAEVKKVLPMIEQQLQPFHAIPHWGKLFTMQPSRVQSLYKKLPDFRQLLQQYDPQRKFSNHFLETFIFGRGKQYRV